MRTEDIERTCLKFILKQRKIFLIYISRDPAVQALQFLESLDSKDTNQKAQFFRNSLTEVFPIIPKVVCNSILLIIPILY